MLEKANRLQDPKKRTTPTSGLFFRTLRILRLRPQNPKNPKNPKNRTTAKISMNLLIGQIRTSQNSRGDSDYGHLTI